MNKNNQISSSIVEVIDFLTKLKPFNLLPILIYKWLVKFYISFWFYSRNSGDYVIDVCSSGDAS